MLITGCDESTSSCLEKLYLQFKVVTLSSCCSPIDNDTQFNMEVAPHMKALLHQVYQNVQAECDILHALPEETIICTSEDEIMKNGETTL